MPVTVPPSLLIVLQVLRPCFTAPSFATLAALVTGALSGAGRRTVTGMWQAAGLAGSVHWSRAHRFFSRAVRDLDQVGLALARAVVARLVPDGGAVTVAVDDTLFHRYGKKVHGARYQHDGSARGRDGIGRGNCFVIAGIVVSVPFLARQVCLPVLFRLHIPKTSASKTEQARALVDLLAAALDGRTVHVVGDALYRGPAWRHLPAHVTFTTRLAANAVLYGPEPPRTGKRGHPAWKGQRLGSAAEIAAAATWRRTRVTRYGTTETVDLAVINCLWWGSLHRTPVRVILVRDLDETKPCTLALASTDLTTPGGQIVARYASRWSVEMVFPQLAKGRVRPIGGGREHVADLDVAVGDDHAVDEQLGQLAPLLERGGGEPGAGGVAECLDPVGDGAEFQPLPGRGIQLALLGEQRVAAAVQFLPLAFQLL
jgi:hypothetical protein